MVHLLNQYIDGPGLTVVIGAEHARPDLRSVQPDRLDGGGRRRHPDGRRHRPDADALFARDCAGRRHDAGGVARPARRELIAMPRLVSTSIRRRRMHRQDAPSHA